MTNVLFYFQCERQRQKSFSQRASLHLDLASPQQQEQEEEEEEGVGESEEGEDGGGRGERKKSSFVTVINVPAPKEASNGEAAGEVAGRPVNGFKSGPASSSGSGTYNSGTYTKPRPAKREPQGAGSLGRRPLPRLPGGGRLYRRQESRESLGSVSSPLSPSSPVEGGGEAPALMLDSSSPSPPTTTNSSGRTKPEPPVRAPRAREQDQKSVSSSEDLHLSSSRGSDLLTSSRGRPDGGEGEEDVPPPAPLDRTSKVNMQKHNFGKMCKSLEK